MMDQAEPSLPSKRPRRDRRPDALQQRPDPAPQRDRERRADPVPRQRPGEPAIRLDHPVIIGYNGSSSSRNAMAYAAGVAMRLSRPLVIVYVCSSGVYCEPLTGQVVGIQRDTEALERWLLAELDQVTGGLCGCGAGAGAGPGANAGSADGAVLEVHVRTRRGTPARELAAAAAEFSADALVIGAPAHFWHRIAGSVPGWLARHARCPVIVVP